MKYFPRPFFFPSWSLFMCFRRIGQDGYVSAVLGGQSPGPDNPAFSFLFFFLFLPCLKKTLSYHAISTVIGNALELAGCVFFIGGCRSHA